MLPKHGKTFPLDGNRSGSTMIDLIVKALSQKFSKPDSQ